MDAAAVLDSARRAAAYVRDRADDIETERRLPADVVDTLRDAGLLRLCVPACYGGPEADPLTYIGAIEEVAAADGSAGWCVMIASSTSSMAGLLPPDHAREVFGNPGLVAGGAFAPTGTAHAVPGGHLVTGRWMWGSGTTHCDWITGGSITDGGEFHLMFLPRADVTILDTWYVSGLRGTGSNDFTVDGAFVPDGRSVQPGITKPQVDAPLARVPNFNLLAAGVAATTLGMARRAIDEVVALAQGKRPAFSSKTLAASATAQIEVARAEAALGGARSFLYDALGDVWDTVLRGDRPTIAQRAHVRLACVHAAERSAEAVDRAYTAAGGSSVFSASPLQRCFRDVHTATQHLMVSHRLYETLGKLAMGGEIDTTTL